MLVENCSSGYDVLKTSLICYGFLNYEPSVSVRKIIRGLRVTPKKTSKAAIFGFVFEKSNSVKLIFHAIFARA